MTRTLPLAPASIATQSSSPGNVNTNDTSSSGSTVGSGPTTGQGSAPGVPGSIDASTTGNSSLAGTGIGAGAGPAAGLGTSGSGGGLAGPIGGAVGGTVVLLVGGLVAGHIGPSATNFLLKKPQLVPNSHSHYRTHQAIRPKMWMILRLRSSTLRQKARTMTLGASEREGRAHVSLDDARSRAHGSTNSSTLSDANVSVEKTSSLHLGTMGPGSWSWSRPEETAHPLFHYFAAPLNLLGEPTLPYQGKPWGVIDKYNPVQEDEIALFPLNSVKTCRFFSGTVGGSEQMWVADLIDHYLNCGKDLHETLDRQLTTRAIGMFPVSDCLDVSPLGMFLPGSGSRPAASRSVNSGSNHLYRNATPQTNSTSNLSQHSAESLSRFDVRGPDGYVLPISQQSFHSGMVRPSHSDYARYHSSAMPLIPTEVVGLRSIGALLAATGSGSGYPNTLRSNFASGPPRTVSQRFIVGDQHEHLSITPPSRAV
ncbi:hypothetical protein HDU93_008591 [Gonapodya sp. JEL0774]|nr:hypothetical protein HDU93_008591 [Gonapodya sp. JEL0774]